MQAYDTTVQDVFGNAIPGGITQTGASVTVYVGGTSILASIFADQSGAQPLQNPFTSGPNGQITFFAANGNYDVTVSYSGFTITKHIILFDPSGNLQSFQGTIVSGSVAGGGSISVTAQLPTAGTYDVTVGIQTADFNHGTQTKWLVTWNGGHANNFSATQQIGTTITVGGLAPTSPTLTVTTAGLLTIGATAAVGAATQSYTVNLYWNKDNSLN